MEYVCSFGCERGVFSMNLGFKKSIASVALICGFASQVATAQSVELEIEEFRNFLKSSSLIKEFDVEGVFQIVKMLREEGKEGDKKRIDSLQFSEKMEKLDVADKEALFIWFTYKESRNSIGRFVYKILKLNLVNRCFKDVDFNIAYSFLLAALKSNIK